MLNFFRRSFAQLIGPQLNGDQGRLTVLLDLDETLVHVFNPREESGYQYKPDIQEDAYVVFPERQSQLFIYKRPFLDSFLDFLHTHFEPIVWATGEKAYVDKVVDAIDPKGVFRHRLYQEDCIYERAWNFPQYEFLKDIRVLNRDPRRVIVVDDDWQGMYFQPDNFLYLEKYEAFYEDTWLRDEIPQYLMDMKDMEDVRPYMRAKFMLKYAWASEEMLYKLTDEDVRMAEYLALDDIKDYKQDYKKLKEKYDEVFKIKTKFIPESKLW